MTRTAVAAEFPARSSAGTKRRLAKQVRAAPPKPCPVGASDKIEQLTFDGAAWPEDEVKEVTPCDRTDNTYDKCAAATKHKLAVRVSADSAESGQTEFGVAFSEQVVIEYYATEGIFEHDIKIASDAENGWAARKSASGQDLTLWFVVHDDRGGATWTTRQVHVD